jgi:hypothetical protein
MVPDRSETRTNGENVRLIGPGSAEAVDEACRRSVVGKLLPNALYVHRTALEALDPLLRVYEGCDRAHLGEIHGANLIKLHRLSGKVSYLVYPDFETDPHPALLRCVKLSLRSREIGSEKGTRVDSVLELAETAAGEGSESKRSTRLGFTSRVPFSPCCRPAPTIIHHNRGRRSRTSRSAWSAAAGLPAVRGVVSDRAHPARYNRAVPRGWPHGRPLFIRPRAPAWTSEDQAQ